MYFYSKENSINVRGNKYNVLLRIFSFISKYKIIFIISIVLIALLILMLLIFTNKKSNNYLILNGDEVITIYQGYSYV